VTIDSVLDMTHRERNLRERIMRKLGLFGLAVSVSTLLACPAPPEQAGSVPSQGPEGQGQPHMGNGADNIGQQDEAGNPNNNEAGGSEVTDTTGIPNFEALIAAGAETVTVSGQVEGVESGFVDFQIAHTQGGWTVPKIVHQGSVSGGSFSVEVPQEFPVELYIMVVNDSNGDGAGPDDQRIAYPEAITVDAEDISIEVSAGGGSSWEGVFSSLPDRDDGNPVLDGPPPGAELNPTPVNPVPDGAENNPGGLGNPNPVDGE